MITIIEWWFEILAFIWDPCFYKIIKICEFEIQLKLIKCNFAFASAMQFFCYIMWNYPTVNNNQNYTCKISYNLATMTRYNRIIELHNFTRITPLISDGWFWGIICFDCVIVSIPILSLFYTTIKCFFAYSQIIHWHTINIIPHLSKWIAIFLCVYLVL